MSGHVQTRLFSLVGRRIVLNTPHGEYTEGRIIEQFGPAHFICRLCKTWGTPHIEGYMSVEVRLHRGRFALPPLPRQSRPPHWLGDDSDGFAYGSEFINPYAKVKA